MNFAWIAALFSPYEVAGPDVNRDSKISPVSDLASSLIGRRATWDTAWMTSSDSDGPRELDSRREYPDLAVYTLCASMETGVSPSVLREVTSELRRSEGADDARTTALTILAAVLAGQMDNYTLATRMLDSAIESVHGQSPAYSICRAALHQQRALRRFDGGDRGYIDDAVAALELSKAVDRHSAVPSFDLSDVTKRDVSDVFIQISNAIQVASLSLIPTVQFTESEVALRLPTPDERMKSPESARLLSIQRDTARQLGRWLGDVFDIEFRDSGRYVMGKQIPDLYYETLSYEILGHISVLSARKELAQMRLLSGLPGLSPSDVAVCLRLLRQAGSDDELALVLEKIRANGPLDALLQDSRVILENRTAFSSFRPAEMKVLEASADILSEDEAFAALSTVLEVVRLGGPSNPPRRYQVESKRTESAWTASAALGRTAGASGFVATELLSSMTLDRIQDELWDRVFARTVARLDWDVVPAATKEGFRQLTQTWLGSPDSIALVSLRKVLNVDNRNFSGVARAETARSLVGSINEYLRSGDRIPDDVYYEAVALSLGEMAQKLQEATNGVFRGGGIAPAELCSFLIDHERSPALWGQLLQFLTNPIIPRSERTRAFDVLVARRPALPEAIGASYVDNLRDALLAPESAWFIDEESIVPYPAALRFGFVYGLITNNDAFLMLARLTANSDREARTEAAKTVARFAERTRSEWLQVLALQLSHDVDGDVKIESIKALASIAAGTAALKGLASSRLLELLDEDGVSIPLAVLDRLPSIGDLSAMTRKVRSLRSSHPSKRVRDAAAKILSTVSN